METQITPNIADYITYTQSLGQKFKLKDIMFKYLDGSIKWAMKELKALET